MCFACAMMVFVLQGGEDGRGTDGGGGRTKTRIARPKHIIKSCVKMHMNSNIHNEFPAPFQIFFSEFFWKLFRITWNVKKIENLEKNFFFSYDQKKLRKIFKKKFFQKFFESCSESSETWKKLKKKFSLFSLYRSRT